MKLRIDNRGQIIWEKNPNSLEITAHFEKVTYVNDAGLTFCSLSKKQVIGHPIDNIIMNWPEILNNPFEKQKTKNGFITIHPVEHFHKTHLGFIYFEKKEEETKIGVNFPFIYDAKNTDEMIEAYSNLSYLFASSHRIYQPAFLINFYCKDYLKNTDPGKEKIKKIGNFSKAIMHYSHILMIAISDLNNP